MNRGLRENLRIVLAITAKDLGEALKNKTTISVLVISLLMVVLYRFLPDLTSGDTRLGLLVYDANSSSYWPALDASLDPEVHGPYTTRGAMEQDLLRGVTPELGLLMPADFDQRVLSGGEVTLDGTVMSWVGEAKVAEMVAAAEALFAEAVGRPVTIIIEGRDLFPRVDVFGYPMLNSLGLVIGILMVGITMTPNLMIEERKEKTVDALLISPASSAHIVAAKALTGIFYCLIMAGIGALFAGPLILHGWLFGLAAVVGALFATSMGLLLGVAFENRQQLTTWGFFLSFPLMLPLFLTWMEGLLPAAFLTFLQWIPSVAMGKLFRMSFSEPVVLQQYGPQLLLVLVCAILLLAAVGWFLRRADR